ncbi:hypothetical protein [Roseisolibacter agri]|uniref:Lipocalin-like domain-containing protein n=1 Tax=Roseisolibacter agri TaxID=2014610 RepID=A0AA37VAN7_9BACT|nr:hypothetical protein [Roseisolibacter agri]GLC25633.1 hypothetical protein rosag_21460 [Roseisolibacter agri]
MRLRLLAAAFVAAVVVASPAQAQPRPDFTGRWIVDTARSDFAHVTPPARMLMTVAQTDSTFTFTQTVATPTGERSATQSYPLDGKERTQPTPDGVKVVGSARATDAGITVDATITRGQTPAHQVSRWSLSPDGRTMTLEQDVETPRGPTKLKLVFARQP